MARTKAPKLLSVRIRESAGASQAPYRVDRDKGIIYGVKVLGRSSPNSHGIAGVTETEYTSEAQKSALPLYEGLKVNVDHPNRKAPGSDRSAYDRIGKLVNARIQDGETYADLHLLKTHPMAERLMEAAEKMPDAFGLSHNAAGKGEVKGGKFMVYEIPSVRSVDVVADPGSVHSLFESKEPRKRAMKRTLREALKADLGFTDKDIKPLFEADGMGLNPKMCEDEEPEVSEEPSAGDHMANAVCAVFGDDSLTPEQKKKKISALLKASQTEETAATEEADEEPGKKKDDGDGDDDEVKAKTEEAADWDDMNDKQKAAAIIHMRKKGQLDKDLQSRDDPIDRLRHLERKDSIRDLCESEKFTPSKLQLKAMMGLESDKEIKAFIQESKGQTAQPRRTVSARTGVTVNTSESREIPEKTEDFAKALLAR